MELSVKREWVRDSSSELGDVLNSLNIEENQENCIRDGRSQNLPPNVGC
jgi:hypothetical protein